MSIGKKKILICTNYLYGTLRFHKELIEELLKQYEVIISAPTHQAGEVFRKIGCKVIETNFNRRTTNPIKDLKLLVRYIKLMREYKPDLILCYSIKSNIYGSIASQLVGIPYINNINGLGSSFIENNLLTKVVVNLYRIALNKANCVFFQNTTGLSLFKEKKLIKENYCLVPGSGVNVQKFSYKPYPNEKDKIIFNFIGRIMKDKGIKEYLEIAKHLKSKYTNVEFRVIGMIEETEQEWKIIIDNHHQKGIVNYLGHRQDIEELMMESHCLIHSSYSEGMANVILETCSIGRPVIASNIPGCREAIDDGITGMVFEVKNINELQNKVEKFLALTNEQKEIMGKEARKKVSSEFDRQIVIDTYIRKIEEIIG